jgi:hypothetical protein
VVSPWAGPVETEPIGPGRCIITQDVGYELPRKPLLGNLSEYSSGRQPNIDFVNVVVVGAGLLKDRYKQ